MTTVSNTSTTGSTSSSTTSTTKTNSYKKDETNFLKLFTEELKNQDPTSPTDISSYYQTINQYYSLQQQTTTNDFLDKIYNELKSSNTSTGSDTTTSTTTTA